MAIQRKLLDCFAAFAMMIALMLSTPAAAQTFPPLTGRVVDQANLLPTTLELELAAKSEALEQQTGRQFVVATVNSLEGRTIEDYGYRLGRHWQIGREKEDDGVILLVAPNEKKVRIETGYGAEGVLPDILAGRIIRDEILPRFRQGDFAGGVRAGSEQIVSTLSLPPDEAQARAAAAARAEQGRASRPSSAMPVVVWVMIVAFVLLSMMRRAAGHRYRSHGQRSGGRRRGGGISPWVVLWGLSELSRASRGGRGGGWGGGGFGGGGFGGGGFGGFSGGGGSFGGGGASGSW